LIINIPSNHPIILFDMISIERQRKNRPTYVELKSAINMGEKDRNIEKLGGSLKASIDKLKRLRTDILAETSVKRLTAMLADY